MNKTYEELNRKGLVCDLFGVRFLSANFYYVWIDMALFWHHFAYTLLKSVDKA